MELIDKTTKRVRVTVIEERSKTDRDKAKCLTFYNTTGDEVFDAIKRLPEQLSAREQEAVKS